VVGVYDDDDDATIRIPLIT